VKELQHRQGMLFFMKRITKPPRQAQDSRGYLQRHNEGKIHNRLQTPFRFVLLVLFLRNTLEHWKNVKPFKE